MADRLDVVLINPGGREKIYQGLGSELSAIEPPLWCRLIAGYVGDRGYSFEIIDSEALGAAPPTVAQRVLDLAPRLVVLVVFGHQPSASTQSMVGAADAARALRDAGNTAPVLIVGGHVSALPERTLAEEPVDFACKGEGPVTVVHLLDLLRAQDAEPAAAPDYTAVPGLVWRDNQRIVVNRQAELITDLDGDLHGQVWDRLPMENYRAHNWQCFGDLASRMPYASIYTSLGCPYKCSFCCINAPFDTNRYRMRSPAKVVAEIDMLYRTWGVRTFKIIDEMFVLNERHVLEICNGIAALGYAQQLNFWAYARVDTVKPHMLAALRAGGIRWLALGIESGSKHVRDGSRKALRHDDIVNIVRQIQQAGIAVIGNFIFGLPDDTLETMRETLDLAKDLNCEFANFYSAMAYPGSPLYTFAVQQGLELPKTWSGFSQHSYDCQPLPTETVAARDVLRFRDAAFQEYFRNAHYLDMVTQRFGWDTRHHIEQMVRPVLKRALLEEPVA
jgi:radical SAM superfamily enzyme YgiQ (UPF0313 family)